MQQRSIWVGLVIVIVVVVGGAALYYASNSGETDHVIAPQNGPATTSEANQVVVINEAVRTLLYLPLYHAQAGGFFAAEGLDVDIVTGGTATNSFAAMLSGEADFSQADPMYVPISMEKGSDARVVAQVVARIAVWGLTMDPSIEEMTAETLRGKKISTHPEPMTAYTYTVKTIQDAGLTPDEDVEVVTSKPGTEIIPMLNGQTEFAMTLEPSTSIAEEQGAHVVLSYPDLLGDQIFTGLMTRQKLIDSKPDLVRSVIRAYHRALQDIRDQPEGAIATAKEFFPELEEDVLTRAVNRMIDDEVIPDTVLIPEESWNRAMRVRLDAGDLKSSVPLADAVAIEVISEVVDTIAAATQ